PGGGGGGRRGPGSAAPSVASGGQGGVRLPRPPPFPADQTFAESEGKDFDRKAERLGDGEVSELVHENEHREHEDESQGVADDRQERSLSSGLGRGGPQAPAKILIRDGRPRKTVCHGGGAPAGHSVDLLRFAE